MKRTKVIELFEFKELSEDTQDKVISDTVQTIIDTTDFSKLNKNSKLYKAYKDCEKNQTPWFLAEYVLDYCRSMILRECRRWVYSADATIVEPK